MDTNTLEEEEERKNDDEDRFKWPNAGFLPRGLPKAGQAAYLESSIPHRTKEIRLRK
jgi:hypothetical protein